MKLRRLGEMSDETNYAIFKGTSACWIGLCISFFGGKLSDSSPQLELMLFHHVR